MKETLVCKAGGMLSYKYSISGGEIDFNFHTLAEVGEPYQQWFRDEIARRGWKVELGRTLEERPYVADFVISAKMED